MRSRFFLPAIFLLVCAWSPGFGQNAYIDSLVRELSVSRNAEDSLRLLNQLTWDLSEKDRAEACRYGILAYNMIGSVDDSILISEAYDAAALGMRLNGKKERARELYLQSLGIGLRHKNLERIGWANYNLASMDFESGNGPGAATLSEEAVKYFRKDRNHMGLMATYRMLADHHIPGYTETLIQELTAQIDEVGDEGERIFIYLELSHRYNSMEDKNRSMHYVQLAMELADKYKNNTAVIKTYLTIAEYFADTRNNYEMALVYLEKALEINQEKNVVGSGYIYLQMGEIHLLSGNENLALDYFRKALRIGQLTDHRHSIASAYMKLGEVKYRQNRFDEALDYYLKCHETGCDVCPEIAFHEAVINIGNVYLFSDDFENAEAYYRKGLEMAETALATQELVDSYQAFSSLCERMDQTGRAIEYSRKAFDLSGQMDLLEGQRAGAARLSELYHRQDSFPEAFYFLSLANTLSDSLDKIGRAANQARLETYFDFRSLQVQNEFAQARSEKEITRQILFKNLFIFGSALLAITGLVAFIAYRRKRKDNFLLHEQKLEIEAMSERVHEADQAKLDFYTNVSHEFKTPLTLILGMTDKLKDMVSDNPYLQSIRRNSFKLLSLVNHLLELRRIDARKMSLRVKEGDIREFIKGIVASFEGIALQNDVRVDFLSTGEEIIAYFDPEKLEKIVSNLLSNAIKYQSGQGQVKISLIKQNNGFVEIEVSDSGMGVPEDELDSIFERFYRVSENGGYGSGIGLALVKELTEIHRGEISVTSELHKGTSFMVRIPADRYYYTEQEITFNESEPENWLYPEAFDERQPVSRDMNTAGPEAGKKTLLVAEDNHDLRSYLCELFRDDFFVLEAQDGEEALSLALANIPDVILSDIMMPGLTGLQLLDKIKHDVATSHIPLILLTAKDDLGTQLSGLEKGADDYVSKPFDSEVLRSRVRNILRMRMHLVEKYSNEFHLQPREVAIEDADQKFLQRTIDFIEEHISDPAFCVEMLAEELGVSRTQLYRKLKALTDYSANQFIRMIRLKRAAQILEKGQNNIAEVMDATGFSNYTYFNNCFREYYGEFPREYALHSLKGTSN